mgnify:CR=1 FL=1|tara:strand:+ start:23356 stop:24768 length:1413 start_codon:yes stop_codon:yes gene_type:complete
MSHSARNPIGFFAFGVISSLFFTLVATAAEQPNVILIMADDVSWEAFGCYGAEDYETPNIDELASKGLRFSHCYSTPICTPSRVEIMTGKYSFRNYTHFGYLNPDEKTFGHLMQSAGYKTAIAGKWQLNGTYNTLPGSDDSTRPLKAGFDESLLWQVTLEKKGPQGGERFWNPPLEHNGKLITKEENAGKFGPDLLCDFLCDFATRHQEEPFFLYYPMVLVHDPFVPTPDTIGDADRSKANKAAKKDEKKNFVAMVQYMDKIIGRIVRHMESIGELDDTIILFTADNGTNTRLTSRWNGMDIRGGKGGMTDMGTHVPLVAYWKGHTPSGKVVDDLVDFTDFYPTLAEAAGVSLGAGDPIDGFSFLPQLTGKPGNPRDWVICHYQPYWNKTPGQFARTQQYKLYRDGRYYDVPNDLYEKSVIAPGEASSAPRTRLQRLLNSLPPEPTGMLGRDATERPIYQDWTDLHAGEK